MISILITSLLLTSTPPADGSVMLAQSPPQSTETGGPRLNPAKSKSNIFEADTEKDERKHFSAKVRVVRDIADDVDVFFEGTSTTGAYTLSRGKKDFTVMLKALEASKAPKGPSVSVTADSDKNILTVELDKRPKNEANDMSTFVPPTDPLQKWDFGKMPK